MMQQSYHSESAIDSLLLGVPDHMQPQYRSTLETSQTNVDLSTMGTNWSHFTNDEDRIRLGCAIQDFLQTHPSEVSLVLYAGAPVPKLQKDLPNVTGLTIKGESFPSATLDSLCDDFLPFVRGLTSFELMIPREKVKDSFLKILAESLPEALRPGLLKKEEKERVKQIFAPAKELEKEETLYAPLKEEKKEEVFMAFAPKMEDIEEEHVVETKCNAYGEHSKTYLNNKNQEVKTEVFVDGKLDSTTKHTEWDLMTGKGVRSEFFTPEGKLTWIYISAYDPMTGGKIKKECLNAEGKLQGTWTNYTYDSRTGKCLKSEYLNADGKRTEIFTGDPETGIKVKSEIFDPVTSKRTKISFFDVKTKKCSKREEFDEEEKRNKLIVFDLHTGKSSKTDYFSKNGKLTKTDFWDEKTGKNVKRQEFDADENLTSIYIFNVETGKATRGDFFTKTGKILKTEFWDETTGKNTKREEFDPDENRTAVHSFNAQTGTNIKSEYFAKGKRTKTDFFDEKTGKNNKREEFDAAEKLIKVTEFDLVTGKYTKIEHLEPGKGIEYSVTYDANTGAQKMKEYYNPAGKAIKRENYEAGYLKDKQTLDPKTGHTKRKECYAGKAPEKLIGVWDNYVYDSKTEKMIKAEYFNAEGKLSQITTFDVATGEKIKDQFFNLASGKQSETNTYDPNTKKKVKWETFNRKGDKARVECYDAEMGWVLKQEIYTESGSLKEALVRNAQTGQLEKQSCSIF